MERDEEDRKRRRDDGQDRQDDQRRKSFRMDDGGERSADRARGDGSGSESSHSRSRGEGSGSERPYDRPRGEGSGFERSHERSREVSRWDRSSERPREGPGFERSSSSDPRIRDSRHDDRYGRDRQRSLDGRDRPVIERIARERPRDHSVSSVRSDRSSDSHRSSDRPTIYQEGSRAGYTPHGRGGHHQASPSARRDEGGSRGGRSIQDRFKEYAAATSSSVDGSVIQDNSNGGRPRGGGGRGRGRGRGGRGGGRRALRPEKSEAEQADYVRTRPIIGNEPAPKKAVSETKIELKNVTLVANYFPLISRQNWSILHYHVDFEPPVERTGDKLGMFRDHKQRLDATVGWTLFDGMALYTAGMIPPEMLETVAVARNNQPHQIKIKPDFKVIAETDDVNIQIYNIIVRQCLRDLNLEEMGRYYYDSSLAKKYPDVRLEIWPGYKTSLRQHERQLLLCVEMTNKVLRAETAWNIIRGARDEREIKNELLGAIVMTQYNKKTYRIDDIKFNESPMKSFEMQKQKITLAQYYHEKYGLAISDMSQPILYSKPKRKEIRRGMAQSIALIPELCIMTGLKDSQRKNFQLMKILSDQLQLNPTKRVEQIEGFYKKLEEKHIIQNVLVPAGLQLGRELVRLDGHTLPAETIHFRQSEARMELTDYDWTRVLNSNPMLETVELKNWAVLAAPCDNSVQAFVSKIRDNGRRMGFNIGEFRRIDVSRMRGGEQVRSFIEKIESVVKSEKSNLQMIMCVLPTNDEYLYAEIKRKCYLEYGVASQCVLLKNVQFRPGKESAQQGVAAKLAVQMNAKLGGVPWKVLIPMKGLMVIGFNISSTGRTRSSNMGKSMGALVAGINNDQTKYFSCTVEQESGQSISSLLGPKVAMALHAYSTANDKNLPVRIIFYRDGVGEGQLKTVNDTEVAAVKESIGKIYEEARKEFPKFGFIVVNKRLNTKFFRPHPRSRTEYANPHPGTVVDDVVTLPERMDFYLIPSKGTGQGTISPVAFNILCNDMGLSPAKIQFLTFKLCHLYFNWSSTVSVPAPCQYAHKLAFLHNIMNKSSRGQPGGDATSLSNKLYYL